MGFDSERWTSSLLSRLIEAFGDRLLFVGHTGSNARGEATETSDIDVNIVLEAMSMEDLVIYREIVRTMPNSEKACGFICDRDVIGAWPAHELFQFTHGCKCLHGSLDGLISVPTERDILENIRNLTSSIYHLGCHTYLFTNDLNDSVEGLKDAYKTAFFVLQEWVYVREHRYVPTKRELLEHLDGNDRKVVSVCIDWSSLTEDRRLNSEHYFSLIIEWSDDMLQRVV